MSFNLTLQFHKDSKNEASFVNFSESEDRFTVSCSPRFHRAPCLSSILEILEKTRLAFIAYPGEKAVDSAVVTNFKTGYTPFDPYCEGIKSITLTTESANLLMELSQEKVYLRDDFPALYATNRDFYDFCDGLLLRVAQEIEIPSSRCLVV